MNIMILAIQVGLGIISVVLLYKWITSVVEGYEKYSEEPEVKMEQNSWPLVMFGILMYSIFIYVLSAEIVTNRTSKFIEYDDFCETKGYEDFGSIDEWDYVECKNNSENSEGYAIRKEFLYEVKQ